jgi:hypothetical protein
MKKMIAALAVIVLAASSAMAAETTAVVQVVHRWIDGFNKGDRQSYLPLCADQAAIIDDLPPFVWHGDGACSKWQSAYDEYAKEQELTNEFVTAGKAHDVMITHNDAYVVVPLSITYKLKGKPLSTTELLTMTLHQGSSGWRITAWAVAPRVP